MVLTIEQDLAQQRTQNGLSYEKFINAYRSDLRSNAKDAKARIEKLNLSIRGVSPGAVHQNTFMSNLSVQYANDEYIGEQLMPFVSVAKRSDSYPIYTKRDRFAFPEDALGERGIPNELNETRSTANYSVRDYGYLNFLDDQTIKNQDEPFDEMVDLIEAINEGIAFRREKRLAAILTASGSFPGQTAALSGTDRWDSASGGNPIKNMLDMTAALWQGRGLTKLVAYCSIDVFNVLARHPAILDLFKYNSSGLASRAQIASFFGWDSLLVGAAREDTANIGQSASYGRIWGKVFGLVRVARKPGLRTAAFGYTMRLSGDPVTSMWFEQKPGKSGAHYGKVAVSEDHKVVASDTGYLYTTVIS